MPKRFCAAIRLCILSCARLKLCLHWESGAFIHSHALKHFVAAYFPLCLKANIKFISLYSQCACMQFNKAMPVTFLLRFIYKSTNVDFIDLAFSFEIILALMNYARNPLTYIKTSNIIKSSLRWKTNMLI